MREERKLPPPPEAVEEPIIPEQEQPEPELAEVTPEELPEVVEPPVVADVQQPETAGAGQVERHTRIP